MASAVAGADIDLVISDIDNTLIDLCDQWERLTAPFMAELAEAADPESADLVAGNVGARSITGRIHAFPDAARRVLEDSGRWRQLSEEQRSGFEQAAHRWYVHRDRDARPYPRVVETIRAIKESGRAFAIHTDAMMLHALIRLKSAGIPGELIDRIYAQPDPGLADREALRSYLRQSPDAYIASFADRAIPLPPKSFKALSKTNTAEICRDFAVPPARALHVGDNFCDAQTAHSAGAAFAWQEQGAAIGPATLDLQRRIGLVTMPGHDAIGADLAALASADGDFRMVRLTQGFQDLSAVLNLPAPQTDLPAEAEPAFAYAPGQ